MNVYESSLIMSLFSQFIKEIFKGVKPSWRKLFLSEEFKPIINKCFSRISSDLKKKGVTLELIRENGIETYIRPIPSKILNAFKYFEIEDTRVIIVGQDPYTKVGEAEGLSFSVPVGTRVPPSLKNIYKALQKQGLMDNAPNHGHLTSWARQGVLLLNRYLTRTPTIEKDISTNGKSVGVYIKNNGGSTKNNMHEFWADFTNAVVRWLADNGPKFTLLLWGRKAEDISEAIGDKIAAETIDVQTWGHPSPMNPSNRSGNAYSFVNCPHFTYVNGQLEKQGRSKINWNIKDRHISGKKAVSPEHKVAIVEEVSNYTESRVTVFTDGGCPKNGKKNAKASYGVNFPKKFDGDDNAFSSDHSGMVPGTEAKSISDNVVIFGSTKATPTNNRGELLAIITAFSVILQKYAEDKQKRPILLVTDSQICMGTINAWIWNWVKKKKDFSHKANSDLIRVLYQQLLALREVVPTDKLLQKSAATDCKNNKVMDTTWGGLTIIHQRSHLAKKDIPKKGTLAYELYAGNQRADDLCNEELSK
jgi:uracil-DNA glycosylase